MLVCFTSRCLAFSNNVSLFPEAWFCQQIASRQSDLLADLSSYTQMQSIVAIAKSIGAIKELESHGLENNISNAYITMSSRLHLARLSVASAGDLSSALPPDESRWLELLLVFICVWITWPAIMDDISSRPTLHWSSHSNKSSQARHPESYLQQEQFQSGAKEFFIIVAKFVYPNTSWTLFDNTLRLHTPYVISLG